MATANAGLGLEGVERFDALSQEIEMRFSELHSLLETKKLQLLDKVRKMKELYQKHRDIDKSIEQIEVIRKATGDLLTENLIAGSKEQVVSLWADKINNLRREKEKLDSVWELKFVPNSFEISASVNKIHLKECGTVDFNKRREPLVMTGKRGRYEGSILLAYAIAVDKETDLVFVVDTFKKRITIYSLEGDFIKSFGKGKLRTPFGICVSEEFVFVTDVGNNSVVKFLRSGEFVCDTKSQNKDAQLEKLHNLCVHNQSVYVCNYSKHRIELFNSDLLFNKSFGDSKLNSPEDIKIFKGTIFVLTQIDNSIHTFNTQHEFIYPIPLTGPNSANISNAFFFTIDQSGNFIISDKYGDCLKVFSPTGQYIDSIGDGFMILPQGIDIDRHNRIVSVCNSDFNTFQIY